MDASFGFVGKDFALVACDCSVPRSIVLMKSYEDKILELGASTLFALSGEVGDRKNFGEYIVRNMKWYEMRNGRKLDNDAIANFTRNELAIAIRKNPYQVNILQAGFDDKKGPCIYYIDYLGCMQKLNTAAQGYCGYFLYSLFDRHWKKGMNVEEALNLVEMCMEQLGKRFLINMKTFVVKIVDKNGIRQIDIAKIVNTERKEIKTVQREKEIDESNDDQKQDA